ncbi:hypothetical protein IQ25_00869 [Novosphingobium taihuense]|uniref:Uncharacterized protein n=1 Tax=Novosphingobium taihuense TaxID=260085 RepID=A0A7W7EU17_9SPHN|nr:hypothetical protein [Novosphingobium taihuense]TWH88745.1 hypothetical protein IQ25_00869 [Novosphingobium taihuense]
MRGRANEAVRVVPVPHHNPVNQIFKPGAVWANDSNQGNAITKALLDEVLEKPLIRNWRM